MNIPVRHGLLLHVLQVAEDAENLIECNCFETQTTCDGTCTHAVAQQVKEEVESLLVAHGLH